MNKQHITKDVFLERLNEKYSEKSHMLIPISTIMIKIKGLIVKITVISHVDLGLWLGIVE